MCTVTARLQMRLPEDAGLLYLARHARPGSAEDSGRRRSLKHQCMCLDLDMDMDMDMELFLLTNLVMPMPAHASKHLIARLERNSESATRSAQQRLR